jgi:hypothetical protein
MQVAVLAPLRKPKNDSGSRPNCYAEAKRRWPGLKSTFFRQSFGALAARKPVTPMVKLQGRCRRRLRRWRAASLLAGERVLEIEALIDELSLAARRRCDALEDLDRHLQFARKLAVEKLAITRKIGRP